MTAKDVMKIAQVSKNTAYKRLTKYKRGEITKRELLSKTPLKTSTTGRPSEVTVVDGVEYTSATLAEQCNISPRVAATRLWKYRQKMIDKKSLLRREKQRVKPTATAEWKRLRRPAREEEYVAGTWEREHIREQPRRRFRRFRQTEDTPVYNHGQFRFGI